MKTTKIALVEMGIWAKRVTLSAAHIYGAKPPTIFAYGPVSYSKLNQSFWWKRGQFHKQTYYSGQYLIW